MKIEIIIVGLGFIGLSGCLSNENKTLGELPQHTLTVPEVHGNVKTLTEVQFFVENASGDLKTGQMKDSTIFNFDDLGNLVERTRYNSEGRFDSRFTYRFDHETNNLIETSSYDSHGILLWTSNQHHIVDTLGNWIDRTTISVNVESDQTKPSFNGIKRTIQYSKSIAS